MKSSVKPGESLAAATARLPREDGRFTELYTELDQQRRLAVG